MIERIPPKELQELVGVETLDKLKEIIPYIPNSGIKRPDDIYETRYLQKIFLAFSGQDALFKKEFRKKILTHLSIEEMQSLAKKLKIDEKLDFNLLIEKISDKKWGDNRETKVMIDFFNLPEYFMPFPQKTLPNIETVIKPDSPFKELKNFQIPIFENAMKRIENPHQKFLIQMPTGSGKTRTAMEIICYYLNQNKGKSILWIANSEELCEQCVESFKDVWSHIGLFDVDIIRAWGPNSLVVPQKTAFIVAGFSKLYSQFNRDSALAKIIAQPLLMIIVDEAHQIVAPTYAQVIEKIREGNYSAHLIGLTATPGRSDHSNKETKNLIELFAGNRIEIDSGELSVFEYLKSLKVLAYLEKERLLIQKDFEITDRERKYLGENYDFSTEFLKKISGDDFRNIEIIKKLKTECELKKKIIFFAASVDHSKFICAILNFMGFRAEHLDGSTKRDRRRNIVRDFKENDLNIICNFGVLTTGFDAPKIDVVFIARPTMSIVLYSQMVGRGLRGPAIGGKDSCKLIDVVDNLDVYSSPDNVYDYFGDYWEQNV
jgi:DNA repair protein RadD